ncbi:TonB-dependent receptor SusC, partial [termite gut metagenome]
MKHKFLLMVIFLLSIGNMVYAQKVNLDFRQEKLGKVMEAISKQTGKSFSYSRPVINPDAKVSISVKNEELYAALAQIIETDNVEIEITDKKIFLKPRQKRTPSPSTDEQKQITGHISDASGEALIGASVSLKGGAVGTTTDVDGQFSLNASVGSSLLVSYLGYVPKEVKIGKNSNIQITLQEDAQALEEVVVVGYGTQSQKLVTISISKLKMADVDQGNDFNPVKMLQGRVTGVNISSSSGTPGAEPNVIVRGVGSISGSSAPLYVVDGIPGEKYPRLNPNDIESIEVLKDASAAAIYGSRANTGVIIITTKAGKSGKTQIDFSGRTGFGVISSDITMANSSAYMNAMQVAVDNYNVQMKTNLKYYTPSSIENISWVNMISR